MSIEIISFWHNEEFLAPFFLNHYSYADKITILYDTDSTDSSAEIISKYSNTNMVPFTFLNLFDDVIKIETIREHYLKSACDWVIVPDADEFVFCDDMNKFLSEQVADIVAVRLFQVYRHVSDQDLDPNIPIQLQRRHGDPDHVKGNNKHGTKPLIARTGKRVHWTPGAHGIWNLHKHTVSTNILIGTHWTMADPCFCIERRLRGMHRQSDQNRLAGNGCHWNNVDREQVKSECIEHIFDEVMF